MYRVDLILDILTEKESQKPNNMIEWDLSNRIESQTLNFI